ncbi:MAG: hypothetical protein WDW36_007712 [Sanguina aurantia]
MARSNGANVLRIFAFNDGGHRPFAIQVAPGVLDGNVLRDGLDWVIATSRHYNMRLLLVLTDGSSSRYGGMWQYMNWVKASDSVHSFYSSDTYKALFFDYITALATRTNPLTGIQYRHDPAILGWDLANRPRDPGFIESGALQAGAAAPHHLICLRGWIPYMANFVRRMDPNHVVVTGFDGFFGANSPHHVQYNPSIQADDAMQIPGGVPYNPVCEGTDFWKNQIIRELDLAVAHVLPEQSVSCDVACRQGWASNWVTAHLRDALRMQKPLLLTGVGSLRGAGPKGYAGGTMAASLRALEAAAGKGIAVAGVLGWHITAPESPDADGYSMYSDESSRAGAQRVTPASSLNLAGLAVDQLEWRRFMNWGGMVQCLYEQARLASNSTTRFPDFSKLPVSETDAAKTRSGAGVTAVQLLANHASKLRASGEVAIKAINRRGLTGASLVASQGLFPQLGSNVGPDGSGSSTPSSSSSTGSSSSSSTGSSSSASGLDSSSSSINDLSSSPSNQSISSNINDVLPLGGGGGGVPGVGGKLLGSLLGRRTLHSRAATGEGRGTRRREREVSTANREDHSVSEPATPDLDAEAGNTTAAGTLGSSRRRVQSSGSGVIDIHAYTSGAGVETPTPGEVAGADRAAAGLQ